MYVRECTCVHVCARTLTWPCQRCPGRSSVSWWRTAGSMGPRTWRDDWFLLVKWGLVMVLFSSVHAHAHTQAACGGQVARQGLGLAWCTQGAPNALSLWELTPWGTWRPRGDCGAGWSRSREVPLGSPGAPGDMDGWAAWLFRGAPVVPRPFEGAVSGRVLRPLQAAWPTVPAEAAERELRALARSVHPVVLLFQGSTPKPGGYSGAAPRGPQPQPRGVAGAPLLTGCAAPSARPA